MMEKRQNPGALIEISSGVPCVTCYDLRTSTLKVSDGFTIIRTKESTRGLNVDVFRNKSNASIAKQGVNATNVQAEWFVIRTTVVIGPRAICWTTDGNLVAIEDWLNISNAPMNGAT